MPRIYKVGGSVRDELLGINSKDIDFTFVLDDLNKTVNAGFLEMEKWMKDLNYEIFLSTPEMFTIRAKFPKGDKNEGLVADFVMARKEIGYHPGTRNPILKLGTLEDDLIRRDFTLNAMARDEDNNLIDLFNGQEDLKNKILRTPLPAQQTIMDDPLRLIRGYRLSITKGFHLSEDVLILVNNTEIFDKLFNVVSKERIREEFYKMFKHDTTKTLRLLNSIDEVCPLFIDNIFNKMWLKPTFEI